MPAPSEDLAPPRSDLTNLVRVVPVDGRAILLAILAHDDLPSLLVAALNAKQAIVALPNRRRAAIGINRHKTGIVTLDRHQTVFSFAVGFFGRAHVAIAGGRQGSTILWAEDVKPLLKVLRQILVCSITCAIEVGLRLTSSVEHRLEGLPLKLADRCEAAWNGWPTGPVP